MNKVEPTEVVEESSKQRDEGRSVPLTRRGLWQRFVDALSRQPDVFDFGSLQCAELDADTIASRLSLEKKAVANGQSELPDSAATEFDGPQREIEAFIESQLVQIRNGLNVRLLSIENTISANSLSSHGGVHDRLLSTMEIDQLKLRDNCEMTLNGISEVFQAARGEFDDFRKANGVAHEPDYSLRFLWISVSALLLVIEAGVNATFFAQSDVAGLVGGFFTAISFAVVDICCITWMGLLIRYLHARPPWKRIAGGAVLVGSLCWTALYNLGVAHYRDVSSRILDESGRIFDKSVDERVLTQLINDPLGLNGVASWALFSLGVFFSAIACVTGYRLDDRIPGYGRLHRRGEEKREDLEQKGRDALEDFRRVQTDTLNLIRDDDAVASDRVRAIAMAVQEREALLKSVGNSEDYIRKFGTAILGRYQDLNSQARQTSPPSYFGEQLPVVKATLNEQSDRYRRKAQSEKYELKKLREKQSAFEAAVTEKTESMLEFIKDLTSKLLLHGPRPLDVDAHGDKQSE